MICQFCGNSIPDGSKFCTMCGQTLPEVSAAGKDFDFSGNGAAVVTSQQRFEYKILSQKDKWFSGKFDPMLLEQAINAYAQQGWRVVSCATADIASFGSARQEFIALLEREIK